MHASKIKIRREEYICAYSALLRMSSAQHDAVARPQFKVDGIEFLMRVLSSQWVASSTFHFTWY